MEFTTCASRIKGIKVFLCTVAMLSNPMVPKTFMKSCPLNTIVVDEASQIHIGDYVSLFYKYTSLRKACFVGDDKQCELFTSLYLVYS
jgi:regulator of nonsense transcripts 1